MRRSAKTFILFASLTATLTVAGCAPTTLKDLAAMDTRSEITEGCPGHLIQSHGTDTAATEASLAKEMKDFQLLAEKALALRAETIQAGKELKAKQERKEVLTGADLDMLNEGINRHLALRKELLAVAESHECWVDASEADLAALGVAPETRFKGVMLSLSAALVMYDNYLLSVSLFEGDSKLRRLLNQRDPAYAVRSAELLKVTAHYDSIANRQRVRNAMELYEKEAERFRGTVVNGDSAYIAALIQQSPSYTMVRKWSPLYVIGRKLGFLGAVTADSLSFLEKEGVNIFSMVFGNAVGLVETRKGKLYGKPQIENDVRASLKAGDILLEKTPFRLTDKLIPGYWGHAAVWIGTEAELKALGIWDNPVVVRYHDEIREGRTVVEALRSGVEMNSLEHFLNIDSIGVMRSEPATDAGRAKIIIQALRQVGKPYDFNFDVESKERVYCSKLVYLCYGDIKWPTAKSLGRATFTPDNVAIKAVDEKTLRLALFYHDGSKVEADPLTEMKRLMNREE